MKKSGFMIVALLLTVALLVPIVVLQAKTVSACAGPTCYEGLSPGYWKNHVDVWDGYSPSDDFDTVFGTEAFAPDVTLIEALNLKGGKLNALARHAVAALLNAAHPEINYCWNASVVISKVQDAIASGDYEPLKDDLDEANNLGLSDGD